MARPDNRQITLKPQDLLVALKLVARKGRKYSYAELSDELGLSASEVHACVKRAEVARLISATRGEETIPNSAALQEFLLHGAKYAFPATFGPVTRGIVTGYAAPPLSNHIAQSNELPPVWPDSEGPNRGVALNPLYPTVAFAVRKDPVLYELMALFDALRAGAVRERELAATLLRERLV